MNVLDPGEHQLIARFQARKWLAEHFGVKDTPIDVEEKLWTAIRQQMQQYIERVVEE
jgi:hypothetical protein